MTIFTRQELENAFHYYNKKVEEAVAKQDWNIWADIFTEDAIYIEHAYGTFHGREEIRDWINKVMAPFPTMYFPQDWITYDEANAAIVMCVQNVLPHPTEPNTTFSFPNWTRIIYAGNNLFSFEEDIYNPSGQSAAAVKAWLAAGGKFATSEKITMQHNP